MCCKQQVLRMYTAACDHYHRIAFVKVVAAHTHFIRLPVIYGQCVVEWLELVLVPVAFIFEVALCGSLTRIELNEQSFNSVGNRNPGPPN